MKGQRHIRKIVLWLPGVSANISTSLFVPTRKTENEDVYKKLRLCNHGRYREIFGHFPDAMLFHKIFAIEK